MVKGPETNEVELFDAEAQEGIDEVVDELVEAISQAEHDQIIERIAA